MAMGEYHIVSEYNYVSPSDERTSSHKKLSVSSSYQ